MKENIQSTVINNNDDIRLESVFFHSPGHIPNPPNPLMIPFQPT